MGFVRSHHGRFFASFFVLALGGCSRESHRLPDPVIDAAVDAAADASDAVDASGEVDAGHYQFPIGPLPPEPQKLAWQGPLVQGEEISIANVPLSSVDVACTKENCALVYPDYVKGNAFGFRVSLVSGQILDTQPAVLHQPDGSGQELYSNGQDYLWVIETAFEVEADVSVISAQPWSAGGNTNDLTNFPSDVVQVLAHDSDYVGVSEDGLYGERASAWRTDHLGKGLNAVGLPQTVSDITCPKTGIAQLGATVLVVHTGSDAVATHLYATPIVDWDAGAEIFFDLALRELDLVLREEDVPCVRQPMASWSDEQAAYIYTQIDDAGVSHVRSLSLDVNGTALLPVQELFVETGKITDVRSFADGDAWFLAYAVNKNLLIRRVNRHTAGPALKLASLQNKYDFAFAGEGLIFLAQLVPGDNDTGKIVMRFSHLPAAAP